MASTYTELSNQLWDAAKIEQATCESEGIYESGHAKMLRAAARALEMSDRMCAAGAAKEKLLQLAKLRIETERLYKELHDDFFEDLSGFDVTQILYNCTIDSEGLKNAAGELLSRDGRRMDEPLGYFVNQSCGYCEDDYYGTMYVSVDDKGTFVAVDYHC